MLQCNWNRATREGTELEHPVNPEHFSFHSAQQIMKRIAILASLSILSGMGSFAGCRKPSAEQSWHEPNYLFAEVMEISQQEEMDKPLAEARALLTEWFGTIDNPKIPEVLNDSEFEDLFSFENVKLAAGEPSKPGLYVKRQCASCHGPTGQGRGPVAASQDPYPRDFRAGVFKFKTSPRSAKPLKEDIEHVLRKGLSGSQMPVFSDLSDQEIKALVDYVVFLSVRGEFERKLLQNAAIESPGESIYDVALLGNNTPDAKKALEDQRTNASDMLTAIAERWIHAPDAVEEYPPPEFPLYGSASEDQQVALQESIAKGKELFVKETSACSKCHGVNADGVSTQLPDYDDWTKEWTTKIELSPIDLNELSPLMARGGMKPQALKPRNIVEGHLRGGREPSDIYRRIRYGIAGSPMPAANIVTSRDEPGLTEDDVWHLVNYVLSIAQVPPPPKPVSSDSTGTVAQSK